MIKDVSRFIGQSEFYQKYGCKYHWQVGSTTVYPIQTWADAREIEIQLDPNSCAQWHKRMLKKLEKQIREKFGDIIEWAYIVRNDGSCPDEARIKIK